MKLKQIAENEAKKAVHKEKLRKVEELQESTIKWRKNLDQSLFEHRKYMSNMNLFMTHSIVFMKQMCMNDFGMSNDQYQEELMKALQLHKEINQNMVSVDKVLEGAIEECDLTKEANSQP